MTPTAAGIMACLRAEGGSVTGKVTSGVVLVAQNRCYRCQEDVMVASSGLRVWPVLELGMVVQVALECDCCCNKDGGIQ
jgi:hypothetical protein